LAVAEIAHHGALSGRHPAEEGPVRSAVSQRASAGDPAEGRTPDRLDHNDIGAGVGEELRRVRAGQARRQLDDPEPPNASIVIAYRRPQR
jgi:hypothetical protein